MILVFDIVNFPFLHVEQQGGWGEGGGSGAERTFLSAIHSPQVMNIFQF